MFLMIHLPPYFILFPEKFRLKRLFWINSDLQQLTGFATTKLLYAIKLINFLL